MTDTKKLKAIIDNSGVSIAFLARRLGCTRNRIYAILDGAECRASEIVALANALNLTPGERDDIFLPEKVIVNH